MRRSSADVVSARDVISAGDVVAHAPIAQELRASGAVVHVIGDANDIGYIEGAISSAGEIAREI